MHVTYSLISNTFTYPRINLTERKSFSNRQIFFFNWLKGGQNKFHSHALSLLQNPAVSRSAISGVSYCLATGTWKEPASHPRDWQYFESLYAKETGTSLCDTELVRVNLHDYISLLSLATILLCSVPAITRSLLLDRGLVLFSG